MSQGCVQPLDRQGVKPFAHERQQLVDCIRMLEKAEIIDFNGHCSIRVGEDRILINQGNCQRSQLTVDDIVTIDMDGHLIEGVANPPLEFHLHTGIYRARVDVKAIVHAHPKWSTYLTMTGHAYQPVFAQGVLPGEAPVLDTPASINTRPMADALAKVLGERPSALMKSHGAVTVGKTIVEAFVLAVYLEENAQRQYMALQMASLTCSTPRSGRRRWRSSGRQACSAAPGITIGRSSDFV